MILVFVVLAIALVIVGVKFVPRVIETMQIGAEAPQELIKEPVCGNNILEAGEECDATYDAAGNKIEGEDSACGGSQCQANCTCA